MDLPALKINAVLLLTSAEIAVSCPRDWETRIVIAMTGGEELKISEKRVAGDRKDVHGTRGTGWRIA